METAVNSNVKINSKLIKWETVEFRQHEWDDPDHPGKKACGFYLQGKPMMGSNNESKLLAMLYSGSCASKGQDPNIHMFVFCPRKYDRDGVLTRDEWPAWEELYKSGGLKTFYAVKAEVSLREDDWFTRKWTQKLRDFNVGDDVLDGNGKIRVYKTVTVTLFCDDKGVPFNDPETEARRWLGRALKEKSIVMLNSTEKPEEKPAAKEKSFAEKVEEEIARLMAENPIMPEAAVKMTAEANIKAAETQTTNRND